MQSILWEDDHLPVGASAKQGAIESGRRTVQREIRFALASSACKGRREDGRALRAIFGSEIATILKVF